MTLAKKSDREGRSGEARRLAIGGAALGVCLMIALGAWAMWRPAGEGAPLTAPAEVPSGSRTVASTSPGTSVAPDLRSGDPSVDGWESEVVSEKIEGQLKRIAKWLDDPSRMTTAEVRSLADPGFRGAEPRPKSLKTVFDGEPFKIERASRLSGADASGGERPYRGVQGFEAAMRALRRPYDGAIGVRAEFKLLHIELRGDSVVTSQSFSISSVDSEGPVEEHSTWRSDWTGGEDPRLKSLVIEDYERSRAWSEGPLFSDCTESVLAHRLADDELLGRGLPHWYQRIEKRFGQSPLGYHGLSLGDVNGDGLDDLYLGNPGGIPNRLFVQNRDGTLTGRSAESGVDWMGTTMSSLFVDLDNDGDQDLVVGSSPQILMENDGQGLFKPRGTLRGAAVPTSIVAADPDGDGDLDLYVCNYSGSGPVPIHDANNGPPNSLWRNDGNWNFVDATREVGLDENNSRFSFAAAWEDYDNDGDVDLYVANDYGRNSLYRNDGGKFRDVAPEAGVEDLSAGMSVTFGDYDHDGWMDLYVSNMFSAAGNRITYQRRFNPAAKGVERTAFQRHARGNSLFRGGSDGRFTDVSVDAGVTMGRWAWSSLFLDIDNDSFEDLVIANGNLTNDDPRDL